MRLRQIALMARKIEPVRKQLEAVFGLKAAYVDPGVAVFGLTNVVMPVGGEFLEVLEPLHEGASGGRYLERRGGDAGYMVILQDADADAHRERLEAKGVRVIAKSGEGGRYHYSHFHPADCAGVLLSIDSVDGDEHWRAPMSDWPPAHDHWRDYPSDVSLGITSVSIQSRDPGDAAARWSLLLGLPVSERADGLEIVLSPGVIRFVPAIDADGTGVVALDIRVRDVDTVIKAAAPADLPVMDGAIHIGGVAITPVA